MELLSVVAAGPAALPRSAWRRIPCGLAARSRLWLPGLLLTISVLVLAQAPPGSADLTEMSLEDLLKMEVITTIGKREQKLSQVPAAVYVITAEDIERSGVTSVPDALRLAPGVEVAQISSNRWAISIRGPNSLVSDKLLVLVDGRTVFSSIFSSVVWPAWDLPLEDIERIDVIRGPGAALWGANAVNGVINIVTRSARATQGKRLGLESGSHDHAITDARYGGQLSPEDAFRISLRYALRGQLATAGGAGVQDRWSLERAGIREDWSPSSRDAVTVSGDIYGITEDDTQGQPLASSPFFFSGGSLLARWKHRTAGGSDIAWQVYYDHSHQDLAADSGVTEQTLDFDFQQDTRLGRRHDVLWGLGFRYIHDHAEKGDSFTFVPPAKTTKLFSGFGQDEIRLVAGHLWLTLGLKLEHNQYTGMEVQPDARLRWALDRRNSLWTAVSRAVRTPAAFEERGKQLVSIVPGSAGIPTFVELIGNSGVKSQELLAYEAGYRFQTARKLSFDLAGFYDLYQRLATQQPGAPFFESEPAPPHFVLPILLGNAINGHSQGAELSASWPVLRYWKLSGSYTWLRFFNQSNPADLAASPTFPADTVPQHQGQLHSYITLRHGLQFDTSVYRVGALLGGQIPAYTRLDAHIGWSAAEGLKLSMGLQNLLQPRHLEFLDPLVPSLPAQVPRSFYGKVECTF